MPSPYTAASRRVLRPSLTLDVRLTPQPTASPDMSTPSSTWHLLLGPEGLQYEKYFHDRTSVWDGTADDINGKICEFLS